MITRATHIALVCLLFGSPAPAPAQESSPQAIQRPPRSSNRFLPDSLFSARLILAHGDEVGLTGEQLRAVEALVATQDEALEPLRRDQVREASRLAKLIEVERIDEESALGRVDVILGLESREKRIRILHSIRIKNVLTGTQQVALKAVREREEQRWTPGVSASSSDSEGAAR